MSTQHTLDVSLIGCDGEMNSAYSVLNKRGMHVFCLDTNVVINLLDFAARGWKGVIPKDIASLHMATLALFSASLKGNLNTNIGRFDYNPVCIVPAICERTNQHKFPDQGLFIRESLAFLRSVYGLHNINPKGLVFKYNVLMEMISEGGFERIVLCVAKARELIAKRPTEKEPSRRRLGDLYMEFLGHKAEQSLGFLCDGFFETVFVYALARSPKAEAFFKLNEKDVEPNIAWDLIFASWREMFSLYDTQSGDFVLASSDRALSFWSSAFWFPQSARFPSEQVEFLSLGFSHNFPDRSRIQHISRMEGSNSAYNFLIGKLFEHRRSLSTAPTIWMTGQRPEAITGSSGTGLDELRRLLSDA